MLNFCTIICPYYLRIIHLLDSFRNKRFIFGCHSRFYSKILQSIVFLGFFFFFNYIFFFNSGADINAEDDNGNTALSVAERFGNKVCSRCLFQFQWKERAKEIKPSTNVILLFYNYDLFCSRRQLWRREKKTCLQSSLSII